MGSDSNDLTIHDEVAIETEIAGEPAIIAAFVTNILADELWLATRLPDPRIARLSEGQPIHLTFDRAGGTNFSSGW